MVTGGGRLRIVFFGTPEFALPALGRLIDSRHEVILLVSQPDRPRGRGHRLAPTPTKVLAAQHGIPVRQPERLRDEEFLTFLAGLGPDLGVVAAYGRILPERLLAIPRLGLINIHASLLPKWRGAAPVQRAVIAGATETGVTIMRVVKELDAGPMLAVARRPIGPDETSPEVERDLAGSGAGLLLDVVDRMADGPIVEMEQEHAAATYAPKITREESAIDWRLSALQIHNLVRGLQPWPIASARLAGARVLLHRTRVEDPTGTEPCGTIVRADGDCLEVAAGDGRLLRVLLLQPEGRRTMTAREFLAGHRVAPGSRFESG
ncbi:MAG TPA: methionyl-tRNA formyltransferase [Vicinamibacterales bacterium]|nr:methionyl-tRNA formyltransferase [Vicinamibacterales bacterium]